MASPANGRGSESGVDWSGLRAIAWDEPHSLWMNDWDEAWPVTHESGVASLYARQSSGCTRRGQVGKAVSGASLAPEEDSGGPEGLTVGSPAACASSASLMNEVTSIGTPSARALNAFGRRAGESASRNTPWMSRCTGTYLMWLPT